MQQDITVQVLQVGGRLTKTGRTVYEASLSDGQKYTTFDGELAAKAQQFLNQQVTARVEVAQNGQYTNYNLKDIGPVGSLAPLPAVPGAPIPAVPVAPSVPVATTSTGSGWGDDDTTRKAKFDALSIAFQYAGQTGEGFEVALEWAQKLYDVARSHEQAQEAPAPTTPVEVAAQVPGVQVGVGTGEQANTTPQATIPWSTT